MKLSKGRQYSPQVHTAQDREIAEQVGALTTAKWSEGRDNSHSAAQDLGKTRSGTKFSCFPLAWLKQTGAVSGLEASMSTCLYLGTKILLTCGSDATM